MKAILYTFSENINNPMSFDKIAVSSNRKLHGTKLNEIKAEFLANAMKLVLQGYINITLQVTRKEVDLNKPKTSKLIAYQVAYTPNMWVTNQRHEAVAINLFEKFALQYMDGKHDNKQIIESVMQHVNSGEMTLSRDGKKIENIDEVRKELETFLQPTLTRFVTNALLI
jgi:methyltransferase-like protein